MRSRDIRRAKQNPPKRMPASMEPYVPLLAPLEPANDEDPQGDEAWRDALADTEHDQPAEDMG